MPGSEEMPFSTWQTKPKIFSQIPLILISGAETRECLASDHHINFLLIIIVLALAITFCESGDQTQERKKKKESERVHVNNLKQVFPCLSLLHTHLEPAGSEGYESHCACRLPAVGADGSDATSTSTLHPPLDSH